MATADAAIVSDPRITLSPADKATHTPGKVPKAAGNWRVGSERFEAVMIEEVATVHTGEWVRL